MKLSLIESNIGKQVNLSKSQLSEFLSGCKFYILQVQCSNQVKLKVVGKYCTSFSLVNSRSIISLVEPKKKPVTIKTLDGNKFSENFQNLVSLADQRADEKASWATKRNSSVKTLLAAGLIYKTKKQNSFDTSIMLTVTKKGQALIQTRLKALKKTFKVSSSIKSYTFDKFLTKVRCQIKTDSDGLKKISVLNLVENSTVVKAVKKPVIQIKNGDIVRVLRCADRSSFEQQTAKVLKYRFDSGIYNTHVLIDGCEWWVDSANLQYVKTPSVKDPVAKVNDLVLLDITQKNSASWTDELQKNPELPWKVISTHTTGNFRVERHDSFHFFVSPNCIKSVLSKSDVEELGRAARMTAWQEQARLTARIKKQYDIENKKQLELYNLI